MASWEKIANCAPLRVIYLWCIILWLQSWHFANIPVRQSQKCYLAASPCKQDSTCQIWQITSFTVWTIQLYCENIPELLLVTFKVLGRTNAQFKQLITVSKNLSVGSSKQNLWKLQKRENHISLVQSNFGRWIESVKRFNLCWSTHPA